MSYPATPMLMLSVADTGAGITEENQRRVFEPYFTTKTAAENAGLGLSIVAGIVQDANGTISVESNAGKGTAVRVLLPLSAGHERNSTS